MLAEALTPLIALTGAVLAGPRGWTLSSRLCSLARWGFWRPRDVRRVTTSHPGFAQAFGPEWEEAMAPAQTVGLLPCRWTWHPPEAPALTAQCALPDPTRGRPAPALWPVATAPSITPSGLALAYLHGSAWYLLDKDVGTRPFFRHLAAQGHVVMDVAYRLYPETDLLGMVDDVKRALAWMKAQAPAYGVNPERIVLVGVSVGGHLALLAAYTSAVDAVRPSRRAGA